MTFQVMDACGDGGGELARDNRDAEPDGNTIFLVMSAMCKLRSGFRAHSSLIGLLIGLLASSCVCVSDAFLTNSFSSANAS